MRKRPPARPLPRGRGRLKPGSDDTAAGAARRPSARREPISATSGADEVVDLGRSLAQDRRTKANVRSPTTRQGGP